MQFTYVCSWFLLCTCLCVSSLRICLLHDQILVILTELFVVIANLTFITDIDDFIVDEEGRPISRVKKKKHIIHDDAYVHNICSI